MSVIQNRCSDAADGHNDHVDQHQTQDHSPTMLQGREGAKLSIGFVIVRDELANEP